MGKIFGIGLNKTGTKTLGKALEMLGYERHVSCDLDLLRSWKINNLENIFSVADHHDNFEDWPWPLVYAELFERYKDAKFVLTTRLTPEIWYESLCQHADKTGPSEYRSLVYAHSMPHDFREEHLLFYKNHNLRVKEFFKKNAPENLLVVCWEKGDGWRELCSFLNKPVPDQSFPFLNRNPDIKRKAPVSSSSHNSSGILRFINKRATK